MKIHEYENNTYKKAYFPTFELEELISKVVVTPDTYSLTILSNYRIDADIHTRKN